MNLDVPLGSASGIGRKRPYKIGACSDAEAAQSLYPYIILTMRKPRREAWASHTVLATCDPAASRRSSRTLLA